MRNKEYNKPFPSPPHREGIAIPTSPFDGNYSPLPLERGTGVRLVGVRGKAGRGYAFKAISILEIYPTKLLPPKFAF